MLRSALLTFRMHRFEVLLVAVLLTLTAVSALVARSHVAAANPSNECWSQNWSGGSTLECQASVANFWGAADEASFVASPLAVSLPFIVGLLLGVPIVGRELELRTAGLAWSLTGRRWRWLLARFVPMLILGGGGLLIVALLVADMARVAHPWNYLGPGRIPDLTEIGSEGIPLAARGLMTLGIGLLLGAVAGRTLPAFAIGTIACFALLFLGVPFLQGRVGEGVAVWRDQTDDRPALYVPGISDAGYRAPDGTILSFAQAQALAAGQPCPPDETSPDPGMGKAVTGAPVADCSGQWLAANGYAAVTRVAPIESYPTFENAEIFATSTIGLVCILLTFPIVSRRRPA